MYFVYELAKQQLVAKRKRRPRCKALLILLLVLWLVLQPLSVTCALNTALRLYCLISQ